MEWSVNVEATQPGAQRVDQHAVEVLMEMLHDHHVGGVAVSPGRYGCRFDVDAPTSLEAVTEADEVFRKAVAVAGLPAWPVVRLEAVSVEELEADLARATFPRLVGVAELAEILGVSRARASELAHSSPDFPPPTVRLASGPVWTEPSVRRFIEAWRRRPGPDPGKGRSAKRDAPASVVQ
jgi:hypothetical protein